MKTKSRLGVVPVLCVILWMVCSSSSAQSPDWAWFSFDDFDSGNKIDSKKWVRLKEDGGNLPVLHNGRASLTGSDTNGWDHGPSESILEPKSDHAMGIQADLTFESFAGSTEFTKFVVEAEIGNGDIAGIGMSTDGSSVWLEAVIENSNHEVIADEPLGATNFGVTTKVGIVVTDAAVEFYKDGVLAWTYTGSFVFDEPCIEVVAVDGSYSCLVDNVELARSTVVPDIVPDISIKKFTAKAGKVDDTDAIKISGTLNVTEDHLNVASNIVVTVDSADMPKPYVAIFDVPAGSVKKGKYSSPKDKTDPREAFKVETKKGKFSFTAKNIDLTGLGCPLSVTVEIGNYVAPVELDETIVNGKKPIPIQFMMGVKDTLRVDKAKVKKGKKFVTDSISVKGAFTVADTYDKNAPVVITVGSNTFTVPGQLFFPKKAVESCKKTPANEGPIVSAKFDSSKCTFTISIKNASLSDEGNVDFSIDLFDNYLLALKKISVPPDPRRSEPPRPYTFWELTQYNQPGSRWTYDQRSTETVVTVHRSGSRYRVREMDDGYVGVDFYYSDENDGAHLKSFAIAGDYLGLDMEFDFDVLVWPETLAVGQTHSSTSQMTGSMSLYGETIYISGTASSQISKVGPTKQVKVPSGTYQTVQFKDILTMDCTMTYRGQEVGTLKFVLTTTNYATIDFGLVKRSRKGTVSGKIYGEGGFKDSMSAPYVLTSP